MDGDGLGNSGINGNEKNKEEIILIQCMFYNTHNRRMKSRRDGWQAFLMD